MAAGAEEERSRGERCRHTAEGKAAAGDPRRGAEEEEAAAAEEAEGRTCGLRPERA